MRLPRRALLSGLGSALPLASLSPVLGACRGPDAPDGVSFEHGVASGDPTTDSVILWTRLTGAREATRLGYRVATDPALEDVVQEGEGEATPESDYTLKLDVTGLPSGTRLYYGFDVLTPTGLVSSPIGRTKTLATTPTEASIGVVACASLAHGYLHGYRFLAARELDLVVHLGDYIYEFASGEYGSVRGYDPPWECRTLSDYRARHAQYRRDPDLAALHAAHPLSVIWDDHEFANNAHEDGSGWHDEASKRIAWASRRDAARRAFFEWLPVRQAPEAPNRLYRSLSLGTLARVSLLDTRMDGRDGPAATVMEKNDPRRRLMSEAQESWLSAELMHPEVRYRILAGQMLLAQHPELFNGDSWDGYPAQRARLLALIASSPAPSLITLAGDSHASWASELAEDPFGAYDPATGDGAIGVELGVPGISSPNLDPADAPAEAARIYAASPHTRFTEQSSRGYLVLSFDERSARAQHWFVDGIPDRAGGTERPGPIHEVVAGASRFTR